MTRSAALLLVVGLPFGTAHTTPIQDVDFVTVDYSGVVVYTSGPEIGYEEGDRISRSMRISLASAPPDRRAEQGLGSYSWNSLDCQENCPPPVPGHNWFVSTGTRASGISRDDVGVFDREPDDDYFYEDTFFIRDDETDQRGNRYIESISAWFLGDVFDGDSLVQSFSAAPTSASYFKEESRIEVIRDGLRSIVSFAVTAISATPGSCKP
jgi:hypothetical protein